jgi:hypothetical protein
MLVGSAKTFFSENFVEYWIYFIGLLFVFVVMFLPNGLAGLLDRFRGRGGGGSKTPVPAAAPQPMTTRVGQAGMAK